MERAIDIVGAALRVEPGAQPFPTQRTALRIQALEAAIRALAAHIDAERDRP